MNFEIDYASYNSLLKKGQLKFKNNMIKKKKAKTKKINNEIHKQVLQLDIVFHVRGSLDKTMIIW